MLGDWCVPPWLLMTMCSMRRVLWLGSRAAPSVPSSVISLVRVCAPLRQRKAPRDNARGCLCCRYTTLGPLWTCNWSISFGMNCRDRSAGRERAHRSSGPSACAPRSSSPLVQQEQFARLGDMSNHAERSSTHPGESALPQQPWLSSRRDAPPFGHAVPSGSSVLGWRSFLVRQ